MPIIIFPFSVQLTGNYAMSSIPSPLVATNIIENVEIVFPKV